MAVEFCYYCGDRKVRKDWECIGGTIGESHYVCHRKKCQRTKAAQDERRRLMRRYAKALEACGHDLTFIRAQERASLKVSLKELTYFVEQAEARAERKQQR